MKGCGARCEKRCAPSNSRRRRFLAATPRRIPPNREVSRPQLMDAHAGEQGWGLRVSCGGMCQAFARLERKAEPTFQALREKVRAAPRATSGDIGWKVAGSLWWRWAFFSSAKTTVYTILPGRGYEPAAAVLGTDFAGFLVRKGWSVYRQLTAAIHQTSLAHLLRRCGEPIGAG